MYGTASSRNHDLVISLGGAPIDYRRVDFVEEITRLTDDGVDVVFDGIGGRHVWRSYRALRRGGRVVAYGLTLTHERDGATVLAGPVPDQSALHGLLAKVRDLGLPLLSVNRVEPDL